MGCYINPKYIDKDKWLIRNGEWISDVDSSESPPVYKGLCRENKLPVVLVDNGLFYAAAVCYDEEEYNSFVLPPDPRPRTIFIVDKELLRSVADNPERIP